MTNKLPEDNKSILNKLPFFNNDKKNDGTATLSRELPGFLKIVNSNLKLLTTELKNVKENSKALVSTTKVISTSSEKTTKEITEVNETSSGEREAATEKPQKIKIIKINN